MGKRKKKRVWREKVLKTGERTSFGKCAEHSKASGPAGARPQVRAENMGHKAGRLGTWALATSFLPVHY